MKLCFLLLDYIELEKHLCTILTNVIILLIIALYINKLKLKINSGEYLTFQLLLSS